MRWQGLLPESRCERKPPAPIPAQPGDRPGSPQGLHRPLLSFRPRTVPWTIGFLLALKAEVKGISLPVRVHYRSERARSDVRVWGRTRGARTILRDRSASSERETAPCRGRSLFSDA